MARAMHPAAARRIAEMRAAAEAAVAAAPGAQRGRGESESSNSEVATYWPWGTGTATTAPPANDQYSEALKADEDEEEFDDLHAVEVITSPLHANLYSAAFVLTVRSLRECRVGTFVMAWFWVLLSYIMQAFLVYVVQQHLVSGLESTMDSALKEVREREQRLETVMRLNITLGAAEGDAEIIKLCRLLPSPYFFCVVAFLFNAYLMSELVHSRTLMVQLLTCPVVSHRDETAHETNDTLVVIGLLRCDAFWLTLFLVVPKMVITALIWNVGTELLAFTKQMLNMIVRCCVLVFICQVDWLIFHSFFSSSKRHWVERSQVLQERGRCLRMSVSWPGEILKLLFVLSCVMVSYAVYRDEFKMRTLCWQCARTCSGACSQAFAYCAEARYWPWLHGAK